MLQEACHIKNTVALIFRHIECLHSNEFWGSLGTNIFRNSSWASNNTRSRLTPRLPFRFLWLCFLTMCKSTVRKVLIKNKIKKNTAPALCLASEHTSSCTKTLRLGVAFCHKWFLSLPTEKRMYLFFLSNIRSSYDINLLQNCGKTKPWFLVSKSALNVTG